ncbi:putative lipid-transfer protein DIR1 [Phragmites australis]|uniref:putative lipid-transfer protein DIR1 n=1 Tax=Phragmites australis TaxID=29695 RepID=UPI002D768BCA|nr:putative lipid-transfer protein DIR1 [Phragmites australis]
MAKALALVALLLVALALAAAPTEAVCNMSNEQFMSCQPAAAKTTDPAPRPSDSCCAALAGADLNCLCSYKNSPWMSVYNIDPKRAMELPAKCGLATPANC